ncbi:hypothetical protein G3T14_21535 [Methylobacterium sp. BTF04]|uniref:hypothetical protein n=1 Tax=Methylobacterium sp. BTF04 TaxID=2708300 RepID=UPI0013D25F7F|nr:hypothetical protein [Methylobacterium sp. BTF04]NEU14669.1 hypothetical protein [Methylobacterium sp. BTF04]
MARLAVETLMSALWDVGPSIIRTPVFDHYKKDKKTGKTISVTAKRLQALGRGDPTDIHNTGRALDIHLYARTAPQFGASYDFTECGYGFGLIGNFIDLSADMGWELIIYDQHVYHSDGTRTGQTKPSYKDEMARVNFEHLTHVHIQWADTPKADSASFNGALRALLIAGA